MTVDAVPSSVVFNPAFRIFLNADLGRAFATLTNPLTRATVDVDDWRIVELCRFTAMPADLDRCRGFLEDLGLRDPSEITDILDALLDIGVLTHERESALDLWDDHGWYEAAYFHFLARNTRFIEDDTPVEHAAAKRRELDVYLEASSPPPFFKQLDGPRQMLATPAPLPHITLRDVLMRRKTTRYYRGEPVGQDILSGVLYHGTARARSLREAASRDYRQSPEVLLDSLFSSFEVYVIGNRITGLDSGVYHYDMRNHALVTIESGEFEDEIVRLIWGQSMAEKTAFAIFITAVFERYMWRYRYPRAYRNLLISLGEFAQLLILAAAAYGLGNCLTPGLRDSDTDRLLGLDPGREQTLYYLGFGV